MKNNKIYSASSSTVMFLLILLLASFSVEISAKRGCSAFGHSCYGGHGKRSQRENVYADDLKNKEEVQIDYDINSPNMESEALVQTQQLLNRPESRLANSLRDRLSPNSWSLLISKLMALPRRQYAFYPDTQK